MDERSDANAAGEPTLEEKIRRVQRLWDDIALEARRMPLPAGQLEEVERRLARHEAEPGAYVTWENLRDRLQSKRDQ